MPTLHPNLRSLLEKAVVRAREAAEKAARAALARLAVDQAEPFPTLSPEERELRRELRAEARRLGDPLDRASVGDDPFPALAVECAYEQWHQMLFARFLAENGLLMHSGGAAVTLEECAELAPDEGAPDAWALAARYASAMLPGIFRVQDPVLRVRLAAEGRQALEALLAGLPPQVFTADDSLGWVYQFWQAQRKKEVNRSGRKIGGADIAPVTQLFTEPYMVQFLLDNSLGAWWAARHPDDPLVREMEYLRWVEREEPQVSPSDSAGQLPESLSESLSESRINQIERITQTPRTADGLLSESRINQIEQITQTAAAADGLLSESRIKQIEQITQTAAAADGLLSESRINQIEQITQTPRTADGLLDDAADRMLGAGVDAQPALAGLDEGPGTLDPAGGRRPAAGSFGGWPDRAKDLRVLDPCCGSGHFLVTAFEMLRRMRIAEEGLGEAEAGDAVLRENLFGLEIDPRCTQIAAFNLALAAWKPGGHRLLPPPNVACSGLQVGGRVHEWTSLAERIPGMTETLRSLYHLFEKGPEVGSLLDPARDTAEHGLFGFAWSEVEILLERALARETRADPASAVFGIAAQGAARAADLLSRKYHLVCTNVPYLARGKQGDVLKEFIEKWHNDAKADLATAFVDRCLRFCERDGSVAVVTPHNWLFLGAYKHLRKRLLEGQTWNAVARLGPGAFETIGGEIVNVALTITSRCRPCSGTTLAGVDASAPRVPAEKAAILRQGELAAVSQAAQLRNPDARIALHSHATQRLLSHYATSTQGISPADLPHFMRCFWESTAMIGEFWLWQRTVEDTVPFGGRERVVWMNADFRAAVAAGIAYVRGRSMGGRHGVVVSAMRHLPSTLYTGEPTDSNTVAAVVPKDPAHLTAIWAFCSSPEYCAAVRRIDQKLNVTNATLVKVPFDLAHWQKVAADLYPNGLPEPDSDDPTQWLFHGDLTRSTAPLHVAAARLLGFRWPRQQGQTVSGAPPVPDDGLGARAIADGIACLPPVAGEPSASERLRGLLAAAYGPAWSAAALERLLAEAGAAGQGLEEWVRDALFTQHCRLFHNRPFLWHIWDGRKDGFSAIVNCHMLDRQKLERLTFTYLGGWIGAQRDADRRGEPGANARLVAALALDTKLKAILEGEPPYDIYVRWKPLDNQPIGWEPDINDGVRLNIRPFVAAGVLRSKFTVNWNKDRGTDPQPNCSGATERLNDLHFTRAEKEAAREGAVP